MGEETLVEIDHTERQWASLHRRPIWMIKRVELKGSVLSELPNHSLNEEK